MTTVAACRVCGLTAVTPRRLEEMMFGSREPFTYNECAACGSLSIAEVPANLGDHYPPTYYSFAIEHRPRVGYLARRLAVFAFLNMPGLLADRLRANTSMWRAMNKASVGYGTRVLDVGCGNGALLVALRRCGFTHLSGVDPFIQQGSDDGHIRITKGELADLDGAYDFILLRHSLEHMADPVAQLREAARLCQPGGHILVSVPVVNRSWSELGPDWIELDPPRHLFIPSVAGFSTLVASVPGLRLIDTRFDTTELEFYGSELARRRVPLRDPDGQADTNPAQYFDQTQLRTWSHQAREYNKRGEAGRASFLIQRA